MYVPAGWSFTLLGVRVGGAPIQDLSLVVVWPMAVKRAYTEGAESAALNAVMGSFGDRRGGIAWCDMGAAEGSLGSVRLTPSTQPS